MDIPKEQVLGMKSQIRAIQGVLANLSRVVEELNVEVDKIDRQLSLASHPAGKKRKVSGPLDGMIITEVDEHPHYPYLNNVLDFNQAPKEKN